MLNVVNFGGGTYVLYAEIAADGMIEVDPEPYGDSFARPARLLPVEAKALVAAIDLIGEHIPEGSLASVREKVVAALGEDPVHEGLQIAPPSGDDAEIAARRLARDRRSAGCCRSSTTRRTRTSSPRATVEPYALINGREGWYVATLRPAARERPPLPAGPDQVRRRSPTSASSRGPTSIRPPTSTAGRAPARSPRLAPRARLDLARAGALGARGAHAWSPSSTDGAVIVELGFAGVDWLVREVLKEAGDAVVLEPEDARDGRPRRRAEASRAAAELVSR